MPINSPDVFCFRVELNGTDATVNNTAFTDIGVINSVAGTPCTTS